MLKFMYFSLLIAMTNFLIFLAINNKMDESFSYKNKHNINASFTYHIAFHEDKTNELTITWPFFRRTIAFKLITRHMF